MTRDQPVHYPTWCVRVSSVQRSADRRHTPGMQHDTAGQAKRNRAHHAQCKCPTIRTPSQLVQSFATRLSHRACNGCLQVTSDP